LSKVEHEDMDCWLGERRGVKIVEEGMGLISKDSSGTTREASSLRTRSIGVSVAKVEVRVEM